MARTKKLTRIEGRALPLGRDNVDTECIISARHLKTLGLDSDIIRTAWEGEPSSGD